MTPAMRRWAEKVEGGYRIVRRPVLWGAFPNWRWELVNPQGGYVQTVRRDVVRRLVDMGVVEVRGDTAGFDASGGGDQRGELGVAGGDGAGDGGGAAAAGGGGGGAG